MRKEEKAAILLQTFPELRRKDLLECEKRMPHFMLFRYDRTSARCGACGKETYEDLLMSVIEHKKKCKCPECGREVMAVCDKYRYSVETERFAQNWVIFQAGENGICYAHCIRMHVNLHKELGYPAYEVSRYEETQRYAFADGQCFRFGCTYERTLVPIPGVSDAMSAVDVMTGWKYRTRYTEPTWGQCGIAYPDRSYAILSTEPLKSTCLRYSQIDKLDQIKLFEYLRFYMKHPNIEYIIKIGFADVVQSWFYGYYGSVPDWVDWKQNDVRKMLGVDSYELREIKARKIKLDDYVMLKMELPEFTMRERLDYLPLIRNELGTLAHCGGPTIESKRTLLKYLKKQNHSTQQTMRLKDYSDYIRECTELAYDLNDPVIRFPRCLSDAHARTSSALNAVRTERAAKEYAERTKKLIREKKQLKRIREKLCYQNGGLLIRAPVSAEEIVQEGKILNHCVGGYADRHMHGYLHIMFIRMADKPDVPYYTAEISTVGGIVQVRGLRNRDPVPEVDAFIEAYKQHLAAVFGREKVRITA